MGTEKDEVLLIGGLRSLNGRGAIQAKILRVVGKHWWECILEVEGATIK